MLWLQQEGVNTVLEDQHLQGILLLSIRNKKSIRCLFRLRKIKRR